MKHASDRFKSEYCYENNLRLYPNKQTRLANYLQGLAFDFAFMNGDILDQYARLMGLESVADVMEQTVIVGWFEFLAYHIIRRANELGISFGE